MYASKRMERYWTRYQTVLDRVRDQWPERPDGIDPEDVIEALAVLHGLGRTIHQGGKHHQRAIALFQTYLRETAIDADPMTTRQRVRALVNELDAETPPLWATMLYDEYLAALQCKVHAWSLVLHGKEVPVDLGLRATA